MVQKLLNIKELPERSVVIPGSYKKVLVQVNFMFCVNYRQAKESTDKKTSLNDALRTHNVSV